MLLTEAGKVSGNAAMLIGAEIPAYFVKGANEDALINTAMTINAPELRCSTLIYEL